MALPVTGRIADEIDGIRRALGAEALERIVPHVTLVPPVNVPDTDLSDALEIARSAAAASAPVRVGLGPVQTFSPRNPVLYLALPPTPALAALRANLLRGPLEVPKERTGSRPFVPHVTLDHRIAPGRLAAAMVALADYRQEFTFERLVVLDHDAEARRWEPLSSYRLGGPHIAGRGGIEVELAVSFGLDPVEAEWTNRQWGHYSVERYGPEASLIEPAAVVARFGGEIVGVAEGELRASAYRLARLIVAPEWRSHGVGAHLLHAVERMASERGCDRVRLETIAGGEAEGFYARHGYAGVTTLPLWRAGVDFVLMERLL